MEHALKSHQFEDPGYEGIWYFKADIKIPGEIKYRIRQEELLWQGLVWQ